MNMNSVKVHTFNKTSVAKQGQLLLAGVVMSSLLTACGGGSGPSAAELAAQAAQAAQAAADKVAADAKSAAERQAALVAARQKTQDLLTQVDSDAKATQSANAMAGYSLLLAKQQGGNYSEPEVVEALAETQTFADRAKQAVNQALAQQAVAKTATNNADSAQTLAEVQAFSQQVEAAALEVNAARTAAEQAREATQAAAKKVSDGVKIAEAARRYTKLDSAGNVLPASATSWACVKENATGKVWESKTSTGLRDSDWRYRHFHNYAGYASTKDSNGRTLCEGLGNCDAYSYVNAVNGTGLCGRSQWRLPTMEELLNLVQVNNNGQRPNIDLAVFPDTVNKPREAAYCSENMARTATDCGYAAGTPVNKSADGRIECNYQGVDYGLSIRAENPRGDSMVPLRYYGEVQDGLSTYPANNWICYTRLISTY